MEFNQDGLLLIDQRLLPHKKVWVHCKDLETAAIAIETMVVRGAPAIGCTAAFALCLDVHQHLHLENWGAYQEIYFAGAKRLARTRPTAVNLFHALDKMRAAAELFQPDDGMRGCLVRLEEVAKSYWQQDVDTCMAIGRAGAMLAKERALGVLTHCNTGSLATASYGTALGVVRALHASGKLRHVYVDETRPYWQGARLTSFELKEEGIAHQLIVDSAAAHVMSLGLVDMVVVGADRIAANGDTANKIGTYNLAVVSGYHKVPFYVAAPFSTFDRAIENGSQIPIEQRDSKEITHVKGEPLAPDGTQVFNPSFDVTPASLITGIITEFGVLEPPFTDAIARISASR